MKYLGGLMDMGQKSRLNSFCLMMFNKTVAMTASIHMSAIHSKGPDAYAPYV